MNSAFITLSLPGVAALIFLYARFGRQATTLSSFFVTNMGAVMGAISIAICWTWSIALIVGPQKGYQGGLPSLAWFCGMNVLAIAVFAIFHQLRLRRWGDSQAKTWTAIVRERFGDRMMGLFTFAIGVVCLYSVSGQFIGTVVLLRHATGIDAHTLVFVLAAIMLVIALPRGIESVVSGDMVKAIAITSVALIALAIFGQAIHSGNVAQSLGSVGVKTADVFNEKLLTGFGLPVGISLIAAVGIDHQLWQRSFSLSPRARWTAPLLAVVIFGVLVTLIGMLGLAARGAGLKLDDPQLAGFAAAEHFASWGGTAFTLMIAAALIVTGASALNAGANIWALDIVPRWNPSLSRLAVARMVMIVFIAFGIVLALSGVTLEGMLLFIGSFRSALFFPTLLVLLSATAYRRNAVLEASVVLAMVLGPIVAITVTPLWGGLTALALSGVGSIHELVRSRA